uniref:Uncharacterized protein n=1 Tax=Anguilla anguilla TaxID=7936 RepID=A0A0E9QLM6_ANGAN
MKSNLISFHSHKVRQVGYFATLNGFIMHVVESNINSSLNQKVISQPDSFKIFLEKVCVNVNILEKVCVNVNYQVFRTHIC